MHGPVSAETSGLFRPPMCSSPPGFGIHRCMGNRLAEMQLRIVWEEIMKCFRMVEVTGDPVRSAFGLCQGLLSVAGRTASFLTQDFSGRKSRFSTAMHRVSSLCRLYPE